MDSGVADDFNFQCVAQHDGKDQSTMGLGQKYVSFTDDCEDISSFAVNGMYTYANSLITKLYLAVDSLLKKYNIDRRSIGRIEVGTQTIISRGRSVKSYLMDLFSECGNTDIEGLSHMVQQDLGYDFYRD